MDDRERAREWLNARTYKGRIERQEGDWLDLTALLDSVRRETLEEAAKVCDEVRAVAIAEIRPGRPDETLDVWSGQANGASICAGNIRALAPSPTPDDETKEGGRG